MCTYIAINISRSKPGRAFVAIRDNDLAAEVMGINLTRYKIMAFFVGCFFAGIAGSLTAHWVGFVSPEKFDLILSLWYLGYLIVGGMGTIVGPFFGAAFLTLLTQAITLTVHYIGMYNPQVAGIVAPIGNVVFGLVIAVFLVFEPRGLAYRWHTFKSYYRLWPFSY